ncbi:glycine betaine ABC transporter substrate-binding protein [Streptomyces sp. DT2A-34]|uniref:glycine betaine ABC transporter substrate-binding protein n=1 Tax=Streptomyces sp. DT2A-34 TaxID=3051182 RepID=UPI00265BCE67|nr:glycine betaine ABC transporter substrate-binding protein [Streptomyces sp. DT2A-34]MDO0913315.1 glycine betaine ABC transporter substrate-binding protein [Streptomyces sp. DT2A-34]
MWCSATSATRSRSRLRLAAAAVCSLVLLTGCAAGATSKPDTVYADAVGPTVIGTDTSAESRVVAAMYGELLTGAGQKVRMATTSYASPSATAKAVVAGKLGLAPAYESTLLRTFPGGDTLPGNVSTTLSMALPMGITALPPAAADRGVVLAVTRATAQAHDLHSLADLPKAGSRLTLGGAASKDPDAPTPSSLKKAYGVTLTTAGTSATADVLALRSTDPSLTEDKLVVLTDPEAVIPPEHVFPLIQAPYAGLAARKALARVNSALTTDQLAALASSVDAGESPAKAARTWLRSKGLLS